MVMSGKMKTVSFKEVPQDAREHYILSGYRPLGHSVIYCIRSAFVMHNESLNVWTHVIPAVYYILCIVAEIYRNQGQCDIARIPVQGLTIGVTCILVASTFAHLFCCLSITWKKTLFMLDYAAIVVYAVMAVCACTVYMPDEVFVFHSKALYALITIPGILVGGMICSWTMVKRPDWEGASLARVVAFGVPYIFGNIPALRFFSFGDIEGLGGTPAIKLEFSRCILFAALAGFFKASYMPERLFPGWFDLVGHSHQLFHVFIFFSFNEQYNVADKLSRLNIERSEDFIKRVMCAGLAAIFIFLLFIGYCIRDTRSARSRGRKDK